MDGKYRIATDHVRALALQCHAYDVQFDQLFNAPTICGYPDRIYEAYNRLLSASLLNLAISIRVSLKTEPEYARTDSGVSNCGLFEGAGPRGDGTFSIKDVCDKLIHAEQIYKPIEAGAIGSCCALAGDYRGEKWELNLGVRIFSEFVLKWLEEVDARSAA